MYLKSAAVLASLLISATQLPAQWGSSPDPGFAPTLSTARSECGNDIEVKVRSSTGSPIIGATVVAEDRVIEIMTDSNGVAEIPCQVMQNVLTVLKVSAAGYKPASVTLVPNYSHFTVTLDMNEPVVRSAGTTVGAAELSSDVQAKSVRLQEEASRALVRRDYDYAGKLLLEALQLTPSSPGFGK